MFLPHNASSLEICGDLRQGELILIKTHEFQNISINNDAEHKIYPVYADGSALIALPRDEAKNMFLDGIPGTDYITRYSLNIAPGAWDVQKISGVDTHKVSPSKRHEKEIQRERADVNKTLAKYSAEQDWKNGFILPVKGNISGNFGNQRIFNGIPKNPHSGTDIAAPEGTPVMASGDGIVTLSGKDYFYTGNMVIIDHGQGLQTIYAHLKNSVVKNGDKVKKVKL